MAQKKERISLQELPESMKNLVESGVEPELVLSLMEKFGGRVVSIPKNPEESHQLVKGLGLEAAKTLSFYLGGSSVSVPTAHAWFKKVRNKAIRKEYDEGATRMELVQKYRLTERTIWSILGGSD